MNKPTPPLPCRGGFILCRPYRACVSCGVWFTGFRFASLHPVLLRFGASPLYFEEAKKSTIPWSPLADIALKGQSVTAQGANPVLTDDYPRLALKGRNVGSFFYKKFTLPRPHKRPLFVPAKPRCRLPGRLLPSGGCSRRCWKHQRSPFAAARLQGRFAD